MTYCELLFPHLINKGAGSNELFSNVFTHITFLQKKRCMEDGASLLKQRGVEPGGWEQGRLPEGFI